MVNKSHIGKDIYSPVIVSNISEEYDYINKTLGLHHKNWSFIRQELLLINDKALDKITYETQGQIESLYFDISNFY